MRTSLAHTHKVALAVALMLSLFTSFATPAQAQPSPLPEPAYETPRASFGLRAGINSTDFYGSSVERADPELGFNGGLFFTYRLAPHFAIQPEVVFSTQTGQVQQSRIFETAGTIEYEFGYLDVPVLLKAYLPRRTDTAFHLFAGPYAGFKLYSNADDSWGGLTDVDLDEQLRSTLFGTQFGMGFDGYAGGYNLSVDLRYKLGLTNLFEDKDLPGFRDRGFMVSVGVGF